MSPTRITAANAWLSLGLAVPLLGVYLAFDSQLALAQAADSVTDSFTALALLYSLRVAAAPADANHPHGHQRAEPIAALVAAVLAGVLAVEVCRQAIGALLGAAEPRMAWPLVLVFTLKVLGKSVISVTALRAYRESGSPAVRALQVDARNDVLVGVLAILGFFAARYGWVGLDAWLALPVAAWIAASGIGLALENIRLLMGEAPPAARQAELLELAAKVPGVLSTHALSARYEGNQLEVTVHIVVDEELSVRAAHDIAQEVEARLRTERDVLSAMVHVDVDAEVARSA